jgi:hypothetical protein
MSNYSDLQKLSFFNEIVTSDHIGKINLLHAHYLKYLSHEDQKEIIRLLLFTPMADSNIVQIILDHLSDGNTNKLMIYLTALMENHIYSVEKQLPLNINKATEKLSIIIEEYITSNNYMMFFHTIGKFIL